MISPAERVAQRVETVRQCVAHFERRDEGGDLVGSIAIVKHDGAYYVGVTELRANNVGMESFDRDDVYRFAALDAALACIEHEFGVAIATLSAPRGSRFVFDFSRAQPREAR